ncbi:MAG: Maf family protein [Acidobacteriota bacterium]|nr:Maf family protein [Acidobacteriota bacterium]
MPKLILASGSPRRAEILGFVGWEFEKHVADIDESQKTGEKPAEYVQRLAYEKAAAVALKYENTLVLGADTIVVIDDKIIGKPVDLEDAHEMLKMLSGRWHEVLTGVAIVKNSKFKIQNSKEEKSNTLQSIVSFQTTRVKFSKLNSEEIKFLVRKGEPLDKAGAYAVQAQAALFIEKIEGDYWNVVGLPVNLVYRLTKEFS